MIPCQPRFNRRFSEPPQTKPKLDFWRYCILFAALCAILGSGTARAETLKAEITVLSLSPPRVRIVGERSVATRDWSFRNIYAGVMNLGERIEKLTLSDSSGAEVAVRKLAPGEYQPASAVTRFEYEMTLDAPLFEADAAHISWLTKERGFLMLGDLLPLQTGADDQGSSSGSLRVVLPSNWTISTNEKATAEGLFELPDAERAVFFLGSGLRERKQRLGGTEFRFVTSGEWAFSDDDAAALAADILKDHAETFRGPSRSNAMLILSPFPRQAGADRWSAETRGGTVTLLSGRSPSKTAALAQLSFPLAHELFHLWVPNGLALDGNYDWFYEGFTLYQALRAAVRLNLLTFQDYLNALARAYDAYRGAPGKEQFSLIEASEKRWTVSPALVYNKGMLAAFLYDLELRQKSKGKRSLDEVYRELFRLHNKGQARANGNIAVLAALNRAGEMQPFTRRYIEAASLIDIQAAILPFGLVADSSGVRTRIAVAEELSGAQRDLLRRFGYNEKVDRARGRRESRAQ